MSGMEQGPASAGESPEALFLAWLFAQPQGADIAAAARVEIARIGRVEISDETRTRLAALLTQAMATPVGASRRGKRLRH